MPLSKIPADKADGALLCPGFVFTACAWCSNLSKLVVADVNVKEKVSHALAKN